MLEHKFLDHDFGHSLDQIYSVFDGQNITNTEVHIQENCSVNPLFANTVSDIVYEKQIPLVYQVGWQTFMGVKIEVAPGALVPREETELLGATAVKVLSERGSGQRAIDMCCGSGNLACGVASKIRDLRLWASDLTDSTVQLAGRNVKSLGLSSRVVVVQGDIFAGLSELALEGNIDMVLCNPPYISTSRLAKDRAYLLDNEPREAFDGGPYGLSIHQRVIKEALPFLKPDGWLLFEIGLGQEKQLLHLFKRSKAYGEVQFAKDIFGVPRVALAQRIG
ncbi:class I SAM-dependent methyltransferase [Nostoc sp. CHAB 5836]|uniref:N5-glutamine methyltransferase family protein n=1 Tax=Nostoc sp. CHAB 5836 TaxID=2780404 RepID=UPI001E41E851|nr:class I SAM-dependent methyltransferase [Nostoc sp. CHAB 5836]MCC5618062.1 class I SAM-dependent methyltransferase [Nostoc sp. CHAB 5836]